jgi:hypothetical protein
MSLASWINHMKILLETERDEEIIQRNRRLVTTADSTTEKGSPSSNKSSGTKSLYPVSISEISLGYFGRPVVTLHRYGGKAVAKQGEDLPRFPTHNISSGDIVLLRTVGSILALDKDGNPVINHWPSGVVKFVNEFTMGVIFDQDDTSEYNDLFQSNSPLRLDSLGNSITYQRLQFALNDLLTISNNHPSNNVFQVATGEKASAGVCIATSTASTSFEYFDVLNDSQRNAVQTALQSKDIFCIHGPPGTGKTTTLVEIIRQCVSRGERVLAVAPSNIAVDNLA